jgi:hypothetical protein
MWCQLDPFVSVREVSKEGSNQIGVLMLGKPRQLAYRVQGLLSDWAIDGAVVGGKERSVTNPSLGHYIRPPTLSPRLLLRNTPIQDNLLPRGTHEAFLKATEDK